MNDDITTLGQTNFRNEKVRFGIRVDDRRRHVYLIGKTGSGKTNLMETMVIEDIRAGRGVGLIDPHGEFAEKILHFIPEERVKDVVYFNPADVERPVAFNPLERVGGEHRHLVASGIMSVFKRIWVDAWSARMEYILNNALLALLEYPESTLLEILRLFSDKEYRKKIVENLEDPVIKSFWVNEFANYSARMETESLASIQNKVGQFVSNPLIRNIIGQPKSSINMREIMDGEKIFIANLSKGRIGEDNSALLGAMLITRIQLAAMSRVDTPEAERADFFLSVDEFQNFATDSFASILSEARKYRLSLTLAHQYIDQLEDDVRAAVFGNVGTLVTFRIGATDAEFLEKEFSPEFTAGDLVNLPKYHIYLRLMVDGVASNPFSAQTLPPVESDGSFSDVIIENSKTTYGSEKSKVEEVITRGWLGENSDRNGPSSGKDKKDFKSDNKDFKSSGYKGKPSSSDNKDFKSSGYKGKSDSGGHKGGDNDNYKNNKEHIKSYPKEGMSEIKESKEHKTDLVSRKEEKSLGDVLGRVKMDAGTVHASVLKHKHNEPRKNVDISDLRQALQKALVNNGSSDNIEKNEESKES